MRKGGMPVRKGGMRVNISEKGVTPVNSQKKGGMRVIRRKTNYHRAGMRAIAHEFSFPSKEYMRDIFLAFIRSSSKSRVWLGNPLTGAY